MELKNPAESSKLNIDKIAVAYLRVSTEEQGKKDKTSLPTQRASAIEYAEDNNLYLDDNMIFEEKRSASTVNGREISRDSIIENMKNRPELQKIMVMAQQKKFKHLIVFTPDRLSRILEESLFLSDFFEKKHNIQIHYSKPGENFDSDDNKINRFVRIIRSSVDEFEANLISTRAKWGDHRRVVENKWPGAHVPYGFIPIKTDKNKIVTIQKSIYEGNIVKKVFKYYNEGLSYSNVAKKINSTYGLHWTKSKIETIIKNETYTGQIVWNRRGGKRNPGIHNEDDIERSAPIAGAEIITKDAWEESMHLRNKKAEKKDTKYFNTPFLLKGKLICSICNKTLECRNYGKKKRSVYRCPTCEQSGISELIIDKENIEQLFQQKIINTLKFKDCESLWSLYNEEVSNLNKQYAEVYDELNKMIATEEIKKLRIEDLRKRMTNNEIANLLISKYNTVCKAIDEYRKQQETIKRLQEKQCVDKNYFINALKSIGCDFNCLSNTEKRIFIDSFVSKVIAGKENGQIIINKLILCPPEFI